MSALTLVTAPSTEPLTIAEVATHLRLGAANYEPAPGAPTAALASPAAPGNVDNGVHRYRVTFVTADGETDGGTISSAVTVADKTVNGQVALTAIPLGGSAVTSRKLYRTVAGGSTYLLLATIADNTTTTYTDNIADSGLGAGVPSTNTTSDPYLRGLIIAARQWSENFTRRAFVTQTWDWTLDRFACRLEVPRAPLQSVTSITYVDTGGVSQTLATSVYTVDTKSEPGRIVEAFSQAWPSTYGHINDVTIRFVAGYGAAAAVPQQIKHALLLMIGELHERRESAIVGTVINEVPLSAKALLWPYRVLTF